MSRRSAESNRLSFAGQWNRALSIRHRNTGSSSSTGGGGVGSAAKMFSFSSLRGTVQPELSKKLYRLIKSENNLISAHEEAGRQRVSIATQLSEWGEQTGDEGISDISDKVGVVLSEIGEQEDTFAHSLDDSRGILKTIRNIEKSVQPSRDNKAKIADEIAKLKLKEPESARLVVLEQELVRAEAENLVAEAQLTNVTRQKLKESYNAEFLATIERAEKQIILARHGMRLLKLLDDTPVVPGDVRPAYEGGAQARQILNDAEDDLRDWRPDVGGVEDDSTVTNTAQNEKLTQKTSRGSGNYNDSRDSGYAQTATTDRTSYDNDNVGDVTTAASTTATTGAGREEEQRMSGGSGSGSAAPATEEELRGERISLPPSPSSPVARSPETRTTRSRRSGSGVFGLVTEI
ncbi:Eisosome component PIL1-domain-containing protein [Coniochaeta sp. 2T2.1]|nr:Eisosome component PIL1-domain-containing protein [Coniochaeta sp. 2T2.1]